ncbi:hypothetical protein BCR35DRAFT_298002 [Leucosporidium creatinivorum]|uniref:F-box domain-containing protein n=1 Tax=Leucosporidium creatinivorum TaxID=106004 RepID=A0A1Y2G658_9BASI|nr:hypothetical protein BCR35DRAFT_298002 [Leucosporidium creatinivorum]
MDNSLEARSPPSPPAQLDDEAPQPLPSLPNEILQRIIQFALPRLSFKTFRERYSVLLTLCRVNKLWEALAQKELWRHVGLDGGDQAQQISRHLLKTGERGQAVRSLRIMFDTGSQVTTSSLRELVWRCSKLQALQFISTLYASTQVDISQLAVDTPDIQDLALEYCSIILASPSGAISLHHVRRLYLSSLHRPNSSVGALLLALEAPSLDTLFILDMESSPDSKDLENAVCKFAPRLRTFGLTLTDGMTLTASTWSSFTIRKSLTSTHEEGLADLSKHLPTALDQLRTLR